MPLEVSNRMLKRLAVLPILLLGCADDTDKIRDRGGVYYVTDIDVHAQKGSDEIVVQLTDANTGQSFQMSGLGDDGEKILERLVEALGCVEHPESKDLIKVVPCG
jgi:hypothetical protein